MLTLFRSLTRSKTYALISLMMLIILDAISLGLIWPMFGPLFMDQTTSILPATTSLFIRDSLYSITMVIFPLCTFIFAPILGDLSDRIGRKKVMLLCLGGGLLGFISCILGVIWHFASLLILGRAILGAVASSLPIAQAAIVDISPAEKKASGLSLTMLVSNFGWTVGPIIGGVLIDKNIVSWFTITTPFTIAAILAFINAIIIQLSFTETFYSNTNNKIKLTKSIDVFVNIFTNKKIRLLALISLCLRLAWTIYFQFSVLYFVQFYTYSGAQVGYFLALSSIVFVFALLFAMHWLLSCFTLEKIVFLSLLGAVLSSAFATQNTEITLWIGMIPASFCAAIGNASFSTLLSNSASIEEQGWIMGVVGAADAVSWIVSAILIALLGSFHWSMPFFIGSLAAFVGLSLFSYRQRQQKI